MPLSIFLYLCVFRYSLSPEHGPKLERLAKGLLPSQCCLVGTTICVLCSSLPRVCSRVSQFPQAQDVHDIPFSSPAEFYSSQEGI